MGGSRVVELVTGALGKLQEVRRIRTGSGTRRVMMLGLEKKGEVLCRVCGDKVTELLPFPDLNPVCRPVGSTTGCPPVMDVGASSRGVSGGSLQCRQEAGGRRQEAGGRRQEAGGRRQEDKYLF